MTTLMLPLRPVETAEPAGLTLGERLGDAWLELQAHGAAACPVCGERMALAGDAASCGGCGSELR
jgi:hypothetical protein